MSSMELKLLESDSKDFKVQNLNRLHPLCVRALAAATADLAVK